MEPEALKYWEQPPAGTTLDNCTRMIVSCGLKTIAVHRDAAKNRHLKPPEGLKRWRDLKPGDVIERNGELLTVDRIKIMGIVGTDW